MNKILDSDYNNLRDRIRLVMQTDYGQTLNANTNVRGNYAIALTDTDKVTATQWNNLYIDMIRARTHQDSTFTQQNLWIGDYNTNTTSTDKIAQANLTYLSSLMTDIETNIRVLDVANQSAITTIATSSRSTGWNTAITHEVSVIFPSTLDRTRFFNAGGQIRFNAGISYTGTDLKTLEWQSLLSGMGSIIMDYSSTYSSAGVGTGYPVGGYDTSMTGVYQTIYQRSAATYTGNNYKISARNALSSVPRFLIEFNDVDNPPGDGIDELVQGTITSNVQAVAPNGEVIINGTTYDTVVLPSPVGSNTSTL